MPRKPYRIPPDEVVVAAITKVLARHGRVRSQTRLRALVQESLRTIDAAYAAGGERVRRLAVRSGFARLDIRARNDDAPADSKKGCAVCGGRLRRTKNRTLEGKVVGVGWRCGRCGFFSGKQARVPTRYVFYKK